MESILTSIKKLLGIEEADTSFDEEILVHINSALMVLNQLGVGPENGFTVDDQTATWDQFLGVSGNKLRAAKSFVYLKVKLSFDPPSSSYTIEAFERQISEYEWRLTLQADPPTPITGEVTDE